MAGQVVPPAVELRSSDGSLEISLSGRLDAAGVAASWASVESALARNPATIHVSAGALDSADGAGLALLRKLAARPGASIDGLSPEIGGLLDLALRCPVDPAPAPPPETPLVVLGRLVALQLTDLHQTVAFLGKTLATFAACAANPSRVRWRDAWLTCERAGVNALLIVGLISFLTGMILAFQAVVALRTFGVEIFVVNLVSLAMLREMGVIMTSVVLAGRSGSAFAAEIGTMKVNEEISALQTMGLDPVRFLVVPRVLAGVLVMPVLTIFAGVVGIAGGFFVMRLEGFSFATLWNQMVGAVQVKDVITGFIKSFFMGFLVAGVGCLRGLQTASGPSAVGVSTTRSVVSAIFLIVVADAVFAAIFYAVGF